MRTPYTNQSANYACVKKNYIAPSSHLCELLKHNSEITSESRLLDCVFIQDLHDPVHRKTLTHLSNGQGIRFLDGGSFCSESSQTTGICKQKGILCTQMLDPFRAEELRGPDFLRIELRERRKRTYRYEDIFVMF